MKCINALKFHRLVDVRYRVRETREFLNGGRTAELFRSHGMHRR